MKLPKLNRELNLKYSLLIVLTFLSHVLQAEHVTVQQQREVYWVDVSDDTTPRKLAFTEPVADAPENIIRLDKEFPMLFKFAKEKRLKQRSVPLPTESPLTSANTALSTQQSAIGVFTQMRPKTATDYDPLNYPVKWHWDSSMTVGNAVKIIAKHIGFQLIVRDAIVGEVYSMPLPYIHRKVKNVDTRTALELLGGPGLMVVIDPASRTVMHRVREKYLVSENNKAGLPRCVDDLTFAESPVGSESGVLIVGGRKCTF